MVSEIYLIKGHATEKTFSGKFGEEPGGWCSREGREAHGVGLWKSIRKVWGTFKAKTRFEVGNGRRIKFWHDVWCDDMLLKDTFPSLFTFAIAKEAWVDDVQEVE